jgi:hypothetical protein
VTLRKRAACERAACAHIAPIPEEPIYVGSEEIEDDDEPFEEKLAGLTTH